MELRVELQSACPDPDPAPAPAPDAKPERGSARPCCNRSPWSSAALPGAAAGARTRRPCWSRRGHEARAPFQSTYSLNVYRPAVLAGLSTAHVFLYFLFFFFNIFYKKRFYTSNIYMDFYNHST